MATKSPPELYVPLSVNYPRDPKVRRAGPDAELLYVRGLAHAKGARTDGVIYDFDLEVVAVGLHTKRPNNCPDCGRFSRDSWETRWYYTADGAYQRWGGVCRAHGVWEESAA